MFIGKNLNVIDWKNALVFMVAKTIQLLYGTSETTVPTKSPAHSLMYLTYNLIY